MIRGSTAGAGGQPASRNGLDYRGCGIHMGRSTDAMPHCGQLHTRGPFGAQGNRETIGKALCGKQGEATEFPLTRLPAGSGSTTSWRTLNMALVYKVLDWETRHTSPCTVKNSRG